MVLLPSRGLVAWSFAIASMVGGLADLVPFRMRTVTADGARIWMLLRQPAQGERWLALLRLAADLANGVPPDLLPDEFLSNAIAVHDDSAETVTAHAIAYSAAFHRHRDEDAALLLETCLKHSGSVAPAVRTALASDSAVFQARRRHRPDLAELWLAELPAATPLWLRSRAEAALLEVRRDIDGTVRKLDDYEKAICALPDQNQRELLLFALSRWRSELPPLVPQ